ncbi:ABC transporter family protein [Orientia chuto str. Dubai]|uniref:ABC transporter family protein n=1 Tax=Orientia chuto str. Dubai TaxID=1359168 RepID=A0A0F3MJS0_9RICK|nr:ABC transporter family protein [Orientia chuto str. Dubai]
MEHSQSNMPNSLCKLFIHFFKCHTGKALSLIILSIIISCSVVVDKLLQKKIIDYINIADSTTISVLQTLAFWILLYISHRELINLLYRAYDYIYLKFMPILKGTVMDELYNYVQYHSYNFFEENVTGNIGFNITEAARSLEEVFAIFTEKILRRLIIAISTLALLSSIHLLFFIIFFVWLIVFCSTSIYFAKYVSNCARVFTKCKATIVGKIVDAITNMYSIKVFLSHHFERKYLHSYIGDTTVSEQNMRWLMLRQRYILGLSCNIMYFCIICVSVYLKINQYITIGDFVLVISLVMETVSEMWDLIFEMSDFYEEVGNFNQCTSLIQPHLVQDDTYNTQDLKVTNGHIEFKDVTFNYKNSGNIFNSQSVTILGKQRVGLVGFSGSGKTTFVNLLNRLYDIKHGEILIDNQNIQHVTQSSLRNSITVIPQEPLLFDRTIRDNIRYGNFNCTEEEIIIAAKKANIHDAIISLPNGYSNFCGERGKNLSVGQRQRIVIARAILKNSPILILDEATSALDGITEELIKESLNYLMNNKTVLIIAHRLSTILNMDQIIVFDKGNIVETGTHDTLLKTSKIYIKLWNSQIKGIIPDNPINKI